MCQEALVSSISAYPFTSFTHAGETASDAKITFALARWGKAASIQTNRDLRVEVLTSRSHHINSMISSRHFSPAGLSWTTHEVFASAGLLQPTLRSLEQT